MHRPPHHLILMGCILAAALLFRIFDPQPIAQLRFLVFDTYQRLAPRTVDPAYPVRIVDIDEASLAKVGQGPWPRTRLAEIVQRLKRDGAKVVALDLILAEPDRLSPAAFADLISEHLDLAPLAQKARTLPSNDDLLAVAMRDASVVLGISGLGSGQSVSVKPKASFVAAGDDPKLFVPDFSSATPLLGVLAWDAAGFGAVNWLPAHDQVVRGVPTLVTLGNELFPALALEALRVAGAQSTVTIKSSGGSGISAFGQKTGVELVKVGATILNTKANGELWLRFSRSDQGRYISAHQILEDRHNAADVKDRYIFIGSSATGLMDLRATPLEAAVPGVEVHAQALEQMLDQTYLRRPAYATGAELSFLALIGGLVAWLIRRYGPVLAALIGAGAVLSIVALSWSAYANAGVLIDPVYPGLSVLLVYLAGSLFSYVKSEADKNRVRSAFGHYVAPQLVEELAENHDKLKLGGEMRDVTLLFSDVRGFSKISERLNAEELIQFVNALFTPLSDIILEEKGTIDKFMGDAVMAFWNAPVIDDAHAANACKTALRMIEELTRLNDRWRKEADAKGQEFHPVRIGIGLNTGACCVGNVGSPQRFDYSLLGDPVNIASRLESETKAYGVPIIVGERTRAQAKDYAFLPIGRIALRGKDNPETVFALIGDRAMAERSAFKTLLTHQTALLDALAQQDLAAGKKSLKACIDVKWPGLEALYQHYKDQ
nr:adenylate/guanylate cyclase domain-containing protein [Alphaproteobacteria bacterium]